MTHVVGAKGQVVIPKDLRDELGIRPGDEVAFRRMGDTVIVEPVRRGVALRGRFAGSALVSALEADRIEDSSRDRER